MTVFDRPQAKDQKQQDVQQPESTNSRSRYGQYGHVILS